MFWKIPYDPSLTLGSVVDLKKLEALQNISKLKRIIETAEMQLEVATTTLRNIDMTLLDTNTLVDITTTESVQKIRREVLQRVKSASTALITARLENLDAINYIQTNLRNTGEQYEIPLDFQKTRTCHLPLASDSIRMSAQYFPGAESAGHVHDDSQLTDSVSRAMSFLGSKRSLDLASAVSGQVEEQQRAHNVVGTLIITATCTQKNATILDPLVLDPIKAVKVWNEIHPDRIILPDNLETAKQIASVPNAEGQDDARLTLCSGAFSGSSFIGMVHVLAHPKMSRLNSGPLHFSSIGELKQMLDSQIGSAHGSMIVSGIIPSLSLPDQAGNNLSNIEIQSMNSLIHAFDDYITKTLKGSIGDPLNFILTQFRQDEIARIRQLHENNIPVEKANFFKKLGF